MFSLFKDAKIYIVAPPQKASGGPELLHQLCAALNQQHINAQMFYWDKNHPKRRYSNPVHQRFHRYNITYVEQIEDSNRNLLIVPEAITAPLKKYLYIQKCIWWLGANNYFCFNEDNIPDVIYHWFRRALHLPVQLSFAQIKNMPIYHLAQCQYIIKFLEKKGIKEAEYLSDYINDDFIKYTEQSKKCERQDIILYNPKRKQKILKALNRQNNTLKFIPIKNMTQDEMRKLMSSAKIYIDFGRHPGKDRLPREAALCGCCILTSTLGSAGFYGDVPIPSEYKFVRDIKNVHNILNKIQYIMDNYEEESVKFDNYREYIRNEKKVFLADVKKIFQIDDVEDYNSGAVTIS